ncbi:MAG: hypothetical protein QXU18_09255 [Thermoplasmatales archaeon]
MLDYGISKKRCQLNNVDPDLTFSLIDYRNNYYLSSDINEIIEFYESFQDKNQLQEWMRNRPKGASYLHEVPGNKDVIVVIPTTDFKGEFARRCKDSIFYGLHIIFVESGEVPDPYFNYAHNCNCGIMKALEYKPKWIIVSNDDMEKIDDPAALLSALVSIEDPKVSAVFTKPSRYHAYPLSIGRVIPVWSKAWKNAIELYSLASINFKRYLFARKRDVHEDSKSEGLSSGVSRPKDLGKVTIRSLYNKLSVYFKLRMKERAILKRFPIDLMVGSKSKILSKLFLKDPLFLIMTSSFGIFSFSYCKRKNGFVFDEGYINGYEDVHLSAEIATEQRKLKRHYTFIDYRIGDLVGSSMGKGEYRRFRDIANQIYFSINSQSYK